MSYLEHTNPNWDTCEKKEFFYENYCNDYGWW